MIDVKLGFYMINVQMNILSLSKESSFDWLTIHIITINNTYYYSDWNIQSLILEDPRNSRAWMKLCNFFSSFFFFYFLVDIYSSNLLKWGWCVTKGRDSSAGRAEDWKSSCHQFKSGSWHMINLYEYLFHKFIKLNMGQHTYFLVV